MPTVIDAHQHFWQLSQPFNYEWLRSPQNRPICRDFLPQHLSPLIQLAHVDRTVVVQTQHDLEENRWALRLADEHPFIAGVVGWVNLASSDCERQLEEFQDHPKFVGVRHVVQDEPDDDFVMREEVIRGLQVLERHAIPFDLLFYVKHLKHAAELAKQLPNLRMVINHLSKPRIKDQSINDWLPNLQAAAAFPNLYCKLSGMVTEADWKNWQPADLKPYVDAAIENFGPERCMFGSDWPVCELAATYSQVHDTLAKLLGALSPSERAAVFGGTAAKFYRL
jgi:L-fuconolactonase